jgi:hypothetical protein
VTPVLSQVHYQSLDLAIVKIALNTLGPDSGPLVPGHALEAGNSAFEQAAILCCAGRR